MLEHAEEALKEMRQIHKDIWANQDLKEMALQSIDNLCIAIEDGMDKDKAIELIYKFAHGASKTTCYTSHNDWRKELIEFYKRDLIDPVINQPKGT